MIGKFGVGLKDALATLDRDGVGVEIESAHSVITLVQCGKHGFGEVVTLHATVAPPRDRQFIGTAVRLIGLADHEMEIAKGYFLKFPGDTVIEVAGMRDMVGAPVRDLNVYREESNTIQSGIPIVETLLSCDAASSILRRGPV